MQMTRRDGTAVGVCLARAKELVRCKDCKYRGSKICPFYQKYQGEKYDDWFCADGERK